MRNSKSPYLFIYNNSWKLFYISNINAVSIPPSLYYNPDKQTYKQTNKQTNTQQSSFNNIDYCINGRLKLSISFLPLTWNLCLYSFTIEICDTSSTLRISHR